MAATDLGLPPGYRFVPNDEELVELCLLPRIQDQPLLPNDIIVDDPLSAPPWALLEKHGRKQQAFFFAACQAMNAKGSRQKRTCEGHGTWQGQGKRKRKDQEEEGQEVKQKKLCVRVRGGAGKMEIEWDKYALNFHERGVQGSTGWVMHEYSLTAPPELARSPVRLYCIRFSGHGRNAKNNSRDDHHRGDDELEDDGEEVDDDAAEAGAIATAEEDPAALFADEYPPAPPLEYDTSSPVMLADIVNPKNRSRDAQHRSDDVFENEEEKAGTIATTTWSTAEEDAALVIEIEEYLTSYPLEEVDVSANPGDGVDAGAGYDQDLPALEDDGFAFMNSLPDLLPDFDFSQ